MSEYRVDLSSVNNDEVKNNVFDINEFNEWYDSVFFHHKYDYALGAWKHQKHKNIELKKKVNAIIKELDAQIEVCISSTTQKMLIELRNCLMEGV